MTERRKAYMKKWRQDHRLQIMEYQRHWRAANREYLKQYNRDRRAFEKYLNRNEGVNNEI